MANSIFNYDVTLPGVITEIDSHLSSEYDTSLFGTTDAVVIIGTSTDGPTALPVPVYSKEHAAYVFGKPYDAKRKKETSLVTDIENAWDHGCRTIYAMRINGIEMFKDFEFNATSEYKLRIKSRYPSNLGKQVYLRYDDTDGASTFTLFKPAKRATIAEKMNGLVEGDNTVMVTDIRVSEDYSFTKASRLADVIDIINNHTYNNVLEMQIVDIDGNVVTNDPKAADITLGYVFPGVYFMGRGNSVCDKETKVKINLVMDEDDARPYDGFEGKYYRVLQMNTDVAAELPIYYSEVKKMREILSEVGITMEAADDYLKQPEESNKAFPEDKVDYEELDLAGKSFDVYKRLGSGFAITAVAERRVGKDADGNEIELVPKVHEAPISDINRIVPTGDGIYSILEDTKIRYHVLAHDICADTVITGKLPKHTEFKTTVNDSVLLMNGLIEAASKVDSDDDTAAHAFNFRIFNAPETEDVKKEEIYTGAVAKIIGYSEEEAEITNARPGDKYICSEKLYEAEEKGKYGVVDAAKYAGLYLAGSKLYKASYTDGALELKEINSGNSSDEIGDYKYFVAQEESRIFLFSLGDMASEPVFACDISKALGDEEEKDQLSVFMEDAGVGANNVLISYNYFDTTTLSDFVEMLNDSVLSEKFTFELTQAGRILRDEYVTDADEIAFNEKSEEAKSDDTVTVQEKALADGTVVSMEKDRTRGYDYDKHIMYTTSDNHTRLLAQHATYTELKTYPTIGVLGCKIISDLSKTSLAKKVAELKAYNFNLWVKNNYGRNLLDSNNMPYSIGRNVMVTLFQEAFTTTSNYTAIVNGASAYAGFISQLDIAQSSTGQTIDTEPMYEFSRTQLQTLSDIGITTVKNSFTRGYVITDGVTLAPNDDLLRRFFNGRVVAYCQDLIRAACEPFIGKPNSAAQRNSLNTAITSALNTVLGSLIRSFEFKITDEGADQLTYIDINYVLVPMNEIREIRNYIRVKNS